MHQAARRADRLEAVAAGITGQGGTALVLECDVTDEQQAAGAVERTVAELGRSPNASVEVREFLSMPGMS